MTQQRYSIGDRVRYIGKRSSVTDKTGTIVRTGDDLKSPCCFLKKHQALVNFQFNGNVIDAIIEMNKLEKEENK